MTYEREIVQKKCNPHDEIDSTHWPASISGVLYYLME
jgi:hypothetical protein